MKMWVVAETSPASGFFRHNPQLGPQPECRLECGHT